MRKGISSEYPYSAGTYRFSDNEKLIETALSQTSSDEDFVPLLKVTKVFNFSPFHILTKKIKVRVENIGKVAVYDVNGINILPGTIKYTYIKKGNDGIIFKDFQGNTFETKITE